MNSLIIISLLLSFNIAYSNSKHTHKEENHEKHDTIEDHKDEAHDDHGDDKYQDEHKEDRHDDHDDHGGGKSIGEGKAIESVDKVSGFKLSKEAIKTLNLKLQTVDGNEFTIDKTTLVTSKSTKGIYRFRSGFFKFLPIKLLKEVDGKYLVNVIGVDFGDQIVTSGVGLLRVTDIYSTDESEYGHSH